jgi:hypothetical protein
MFVSELRWTPRRQGDLGEASAVEWLTALGAAVSVPLFSSSDYDLIADLDSRLIRVQVKTSGSWVRDRWSVSICTRGGNQSWNKIVKRMSSDRCDALYVHVGDGRRWFIPSSAVEAETAIQLGGPKYSEFEIESGRSLLTKHPTPMRR